MKAFTLVLTIFFLSEFCLAAVTLDDALDNLELLEKYVEEYKKKNGDLTSTDELVVSYIREGKYNGLTWSLVVGTCPEKLISFIETKDSEEGTNVALLRSYGTFTIASGEKIDFVHLFAVMNGIIKDESYTSDIAGLVGWAGDLAQLFQDIQSFNGLYYYDLIPVAREYLGKQGGFGPADLISDLDAPYLVQLRDETGKSFAEIFREYYNNKNITIADRVKNFVSLTFPEVKIIAKEVIRDSVYEAYSRNSYIKRLECTYGFRNSLIRCELIPLELLAGYEDFPRAISYAFADYLSENAGEDE